MRRTPALLFGAARSLRLQSTRKLRSAPVVKIDNGTFYREHPASNAAGEKKASNPPLFPALSLSLPSQSSPSQHWAILSPSSTIRTAFLQIVRGQLICLPPTARSYPYLLSDDIVVKKPHKRFPDRAIEYVGFDVERKSMGGAYLSARYESRVEEGDFTLRQYLTGIITLNPGEDMIKERTPKEAIMKRVVKDLELERFYDKPVSTLSNGQSRRARIGKALLTSPEMLCLDAPFIGLDPFVTRHISDVLHRLAEANAPRIVLSLRPQDAIPEWITHVVYAGEDGNVAAQGPKAEVFQYLKQEYESVEKTLATHEGKSQDLEPKLVELREVGRHLSERGDFDFDNADTHRFISSTLSRDAYPKVDNSQTTIGEPIVEMEGVRIAYRNNAVLGEWKQDVNGEEKEGLWLNIHRGQRWGVFGANGSGKTTFLSLVTSDHPQTYSAPVRLFQKSRLPSLGVPGITIFELQARMGHSSPEVHALFPKNLSARRVLESAWGDTPITIPKLDNEAHRKVDAALRWFESDLNPLYKADQRSGESEKSDLGWASETYFGELSFSSQRILLFLRATIRNPEIVILDEAFSGMDDLVRDKCLLFLSRGENMELRYTDAGPNPSESEIAKKGEVVIEGLKEHQALLCVSHSKQEIPGCIREWICLPEPGAGPPKFGRWDGPVELDFSRWKEVWDRGSN